MNTYPARLKLPRLSTALIIASLLGGLGLGHTAQAQELLYRFNESGSTCINRGTAGSDANLGLYGPTGDPGDYHTKSGSGLAGPAGLVCLNFTSATGMGTGFTGPYARGKAGSVLNDAVSFTITGWYNASEEPDNGARLFQSGSLILFFSSGLILQTGEGNALDSISSVAGKIRKEHGPSPLDDAIYFDETKHWVFFAVTYTRGANEATVTFYKGDSLPTRPLSFNSSKYIRDADLIGNSSQIYLGGIGDADNVRPFKGLLAEVRVYASNKNASAALDAAAIKKIHQAGLAK
ncbi:MAG: anchor protein [Rariglobus sp.]|jgi:hypothetical protein|nr:anchor protein [Rariglobus sp.]